MPVIQAETGTFIITRTETGLTALTPLPADHPFYALIGRVACEWARLEHALDLIIWELTQLKPEQASCITGQLLGHAPRFRAITALGKTRGVKPKTIERIKALMNHTFEIADQRNRIVHDAWYTAEGTDYVAQFRSASLKDTRHGLVGIGVAEIDKTLVNIRQRADEVFALRQELQSELASLT